MGQILGNLTNPTGVQLPSGQQQFYPSQGAATMSMAHQAANTAAPSTSDVNQDIEGNGTISTPNPKPEAQPQMVKPSFIQAATSGPGGTPNAMSPGLTKAGKLVTLLTSGLKGALAGRAAQEQMIAQTGGRRAGGVGTGFQAGFAQPFQQAEMQQQAQQGQAATQLAQAGTQPVQTPYGQMPAALASKILAPYLGYQGKVDSANIGAGARRDVAQTGAGAKIASEQIAKRFIPVQGVGLFDTQTRSVIPGSAQGITVTPEIAQDHNLPQEFIGKPMKLSDLSSLERAENGAVTTVQGAGGPASFNKRSGKTQNLGLGAPSLGGTIEIGDVDNPGQTKIVTKGNAVASGAPGPQSASVRVPRAAAQGEVPSKIGDQKIAFQTMLDHATLLRTAARALKNGDSRTLSGLANRFDTEFGSPDVTNFDAIANAYNHEVTNVVSKGHITDGEVAKGGATLPSDANLDTIDKVLDSYEALAKSKMKNLNQQKQNAIDKSQPPKPNAPPAGGRVLVEGKDF